MAITLNGTTGITTPGTDSTTLTVNANNISASNSLGFRNRIINGNMVIDQRNAGASVSMSSTVYPVDRWVAFEDTDGTMTAQRSSVAPAGFSNSVIITTTSADSSLSAGQYARIFHQIEGFNTADFGWGTASASAVTLSFWVRSSLTGTFGGAFYNSSFNRSYPFTYTISAANTWEQKSITIAGDTSGTWLTDNGIGVGINFGLGTGSTFSGTAGAWTGSGLLSATGATSVVGTNGATFYITGVQLEAGSVATPFERRDYGRELMMCQRYYSQDSHYWILPVGSTALRREKINFPVPMRTTSPTVTFNDQNGNSGKVYRNGADKTAAIFTTSDKMFAINSTSGGGASADDFAFNWFSSAEL